MRELEKESWRGFHDRLIDSKAIEEVLHCSRIPRFTTPQKFLQRIPYRWLARLLLLLTRLLTSRLYLAADATGFSLRAASIHYIHRLGQTIEQRDVLKSLDLVDVPTGLIVATRVLPGHRHEAPHLVPLLRTVPLEVYELYPNKGFDSEAIHRYLRSRGISGYIPTRGKEAPVTRYPLRRRVWAYRQAHPRAWDRHHPRRPFVESTYHAVKSRVGERVAGTTPRQQELYHWAKVWAYDLRQFAEGGGSYYARDWRPHLGFLQTRTCHRTKSRAIYRPGDRGRERFKVCVRTGSGSALNRWTRIATRPTYEAAHTTIRASRATYAMARALRVSPLPTLPGPPVTEFSILRRMR